MRYEFFCNDDTYEFTFHTHARRARLVFQRSSDTLSLKENTNTRTRGKNFFPLHIFWFISTVSRLHHPLNHPQHRLDRQRTGVTLRVAAVEERDDVWAATSPAAAAAAAAAAPSCSSSCSSSCSCACSCASEDGALRPLGQLQQLVQQRAVNHGGGRGRGCGRHGRGPQRRGRTKARPTERSRVRRPRCSGAS
jgi:hypothetical protein